MTSSSAVLGLKIKKVKSFTEGSMVKISSKSELVHGDVTMQQMKFYRRFDRASNWPLDLFKSPETAAVGRGFRSKSARTSAQSQRKKSSVDAGKPSKSEYFIVSQIFVFMSFIFLLLCFWKNLNPFSNLILFVKDNRPLPHRYEMGYLHIAHVAHLGLQQTRNYNMNFSRNASLSFNKLIITRPPRFKCSATQAKSIMQEQNSTEIVCRVTSHTVKLLISVVSAAMATLFEELHAVFE